MCNQVWKNCHVDVDPDRKEIVTRHTMQQFLDALACSYISIVDLTGGAPEMNPELQWFVEQLTALGKHVIVRCNLTIIVANPKYNDLPDFFRQHQSEVVSSLPFFNADKTDRQRGKGVFEDSVKASKMLNSVDYGVDGTGLILNLVYNPNEAFMPAPQQGLQRQSKKVLHDEFGIVFNELFTITNIPVSRYLDYPISSGNYDGYMEKLVNAFNPAVATGVMCRSMVWVGWDGRLYHCDFNQMLDMEFDPSYNHISRNNQELIDQREILTGQHCYGCTAGAGSSCGGNTI